MRKTKIAKNLNLNTVYSLALALLLGAVIILLSGNSPLNIYTKLIKGAFGSRSGILQTLLQATPLLYCGLAVAIGMYGGILNLGVNGQLYMGALTSALVAMYIKGLPAVVHIPICMLAGMAGGAIWAFLPIWLKIKRGIHEVVTALMLNYIAKLIVDYVTNYPLKDENSSVAQTPVFEVTSMLPRLFPRSQVTIAIIIGVILAVVVGLMLKKTVLGYQITLIGTNLRSSAAAGVPVNKMLVTTMMLSGVFGGLAGTMEVLGTYNRLISGFSPGYGFDGIAVAVLGGSPIMVVFSALFFGALRAGGMALSFGTNLSVNFITTLQGIIILLIAAPEIMSDCFEKTRAVLRISKAKEE